MATDYGGAHGGQPWHDAQPQYARQPPYGRPPYGNPAFGDPAYGRSPGWTPPGPGLRARRGRTRVIAVALLALGGLGLIGFGVAAWVQVMPRKFTASQRQQITDWELGKRWRDLTAGEIFPATVSYAAPRALSDDPSLTLSSRRVGVARQASCAAAADQAAAAVLGKDGCTAMLRATYVDGTDSYVVTVGAAVLPGTAEATRAAQAIAGASGARAVHTVPVKNTPAAAFTDKRRQLSGEVSAGDYVVFYTVGYTDTRPREPVTGDPYTDAEMTTAGRGVASGVLSVLGAPVPPPACPGTPGC